MLLPESPTLTPARLEAHQRNPRKSTGPRTPRGKAQSRMNSPRIPLSCEAGKKRTISRKGAKTQRLANDDFFVFFALSAALRLGVKCFCPSRNCFTASCGTGQGDSRTASTCTRLNCGVGRCPAWAERRSALRYAKRVLFCYEQSRNIIEKKWIRNRGGWAVPRNRLRRPPLEERIIISTNEARILLKTRMAIFDNPEGY
jgi:hypothetical protein